MNKKIASIVLGVLLIGIISAGLVGYLSNMVTAEVTVEGPIFYTASEENLIMNDRPISSSTKTINGIEEIDFIMEKDLDGIDFYKPKLNFVVSFEINNYSISRGIELEFGYINGDGNSVMIYNVQRIGIVENGVIEVPCEGIVAPENIKYFYYTIEGMGDEYLEYKIKTRDSYIEILGVAI